MNTFTKNFVRTVFLIGIFSTVVFSLQQKTEALVNLQPNPNGWVQTVPTPIYNEMRRSDTADYSPSFFSWISAGDNTAAQTVSVTYKQPNVQLKFNFAGVVGWSPNQVTSTRTKIISATGNGPSGNPLGPGEVTGLTSNPIQINFPSPNTPGSYDYNGDVFTFKPGGGNGFTREGEYTINAITKTINKFVPSSGIPVYRCVPYGGDVDTFDSFDQCPTTGWDFKFDVSIPIEPPYKHDPSIALCTTGSPSGGTVSRGQSYKLCSKVTNSGTGDTFGIHLLGVQNRNPEYATNSGQGNLTPAANRASIFGVEKDYLTNDLQCSPNQGNRKDCWVWIFQGLRPNNSASSDFNFKVKNDATLGDQVCFMPFVRRHTKAQLSATGGQLCFTIDDSTICPAGTNFAGQPIASQPDRNNDGVVDALDCNIPPDQTYLRVYGNDIQAGGGFAPSCSVVDGSASIEGFSNSTTLGGSTTWKGSSGQFAVSALGVVDGFFSSNIRGAESSTDFARPPVGQTFGNTTNMSSKVGVDDGGNSGVTNCIPDYFDSSNIETGSNTISTRSVSGPEALFFENRDVFITGTGITFQGADTGWTTIENIPSFYLVVKGGNIYINPSVTQLDGVYIAQPADDGTKGEIITCATAAGVVPGHGGCGQQLVINGTFIARQVQFKRTFGKLADATAGELVADTKAAEVFNFSPEVYLSPLSDSLKRSIPYTKYDYITSLPPIL